MAISIVMKPSPMKRKKPRTHTRCCCGCSNNNFWQLTRRFVFTNFDSFFFFRFDSVVLRRSSCEKLHDIIDSKNSSRWKQVICWRSAHTIPEAKNYNSTFGHDNVNSVHFNSREMDKCKRELLQLYRSATPTLSLCLSLSIHRFRLLCDSLKLDIHFDFKVKCSVHTFRHKFCVCLNVSMSLHLLIIVFSSPCVSLLFPTICILVRNRTRVCVVSVSEFIFIFRLALS